MRPALLFRKPGLYISLLFLYLLLALGWWTLLLYQKNNEIYEARKAHAREILKSVQSFPLQAEWDRLESKRRRQNLMILSEGVAMLLIFLFLLRMVLRAYRHEIRLNRMQSNFLLSVTHELKTPLAALQLSWDTLRRHRTTPEQMQQITGTGVAETARLTRMVENILTALRLEDRYEPMIQAVDPAMELTQAVERIRASYPQCRFELASEETGYGKVFLDLPSFRQVIAHVLENAAKYSTLHAGPLARVEAECRVHPGRVEVRILDNGPGISSHESRRIFERFYRGGDEEIRKTAGTGLGLYIAGQLVFQMHGQISASNRPEGGACFLIQLPVRQA